MQKKLIRHTLFWAIVLGLLFVGRAFAIPCLRVNPYITLPHGTVEGHLDNGLRYIIMPNELPRHNIEVRMVMNVGSLQEENDQRGGAHFLEHSAFIGSKHFPKRALIDYFERQGMKFGRDINAFTGFDRTIYWLSLPYHSQDKAVLDTTFLALRDWLCDLTFDDERVKKERGVIVEELRSYQQNDDFYKLKMGQNRYADRIPLGTEQDINSIDSNRLKAFYQRWYTPSHATVLVVGQVKVAEVVEKLRKTLGTIPAKVDQKPFKPLPMTYAKGAAWMQLADSMQRESKLELIIPHATIVERVLPEVVKKQQMRMLVQCLSERLAADSVRCNVSNDWYLADKDHFVFSLRGASSSQLAQQLAATSYECHRLLQRGVGKDELQQLIDMRLAHLQPDTTQQLSSDLCDDFVDYIMAGDRPLWHPKDVEWVRNQVKMTTSAQLQECLESILSAMKRSRLYAYTYAADDTKTGLLDAKQADSAWKKGWKRSIEPYVFKLKKEVKEDTISQPLCLKQTPKMTNESIKYSKKWPELGVEEIQLTNGVKLIVRPTLEEDSTLYLAVVGRGGTADLTTQQQLKLHDAVSYVDMGGLSKVPSDTLLTVMTQQQLSMTVGEDAYWHQLLASSPEKHATALLNLVYEKMCFPGVNHEDFAETIASEQENLGKETLLDKLLAHDSDRLMTNTIDSLVGNGTANSERLLTKATLKALNIDSLTHYYKQLFGNPTGLTVILTGNFNVGHVVPKAVATFAQLQVPATPLPLNNAPFTPNKRVYSKGFEGGNDHQTVVNYIFSGNYVPSLRATLGMKLIRDVLQDRVLKVLRESENIVYSPYVDLSYNGIPQQKYHFVINLSLKDENRKRAEMLLQDIVKDLKERPVSTGELNKLKRSFLVTKDKVLNDKSPAEWKTALISLVKNGESLQDFNDYTECLHGITPEMIQQMVNEMFDWNHRIVVYKSQK